ncbi:porin family protein [Bacteroidota bacterium]
MKNSILIVLSVLFLLNIYALSAQETKNKQVRLGLNISPNLSWMKPGSGDYSSEGSIIGFSYGIMSEFSLTDNYFIATGIHITTTGGKFKYDDRRNVNSVPTDINLTRKYKLRYIEIPLLLKMKTRQIGAFSYFGAFGLGTSFNIFANADDEFIYSDNTGIHQESENDNDIGSKINFLKESLIIGGGVEYSLGGSTSIVLSILYNNGFTDILSGSNNLTSKKEKASSRLIELNIGVIF